MKYCSRWTMWSDGPPTVHVALKFLVRELRVLGLVRPVAAVLAFVLALLALLPLVLRAVVGALLAKRILGRLVLLGGHRKPCATRPPPLEVASWARRAPVLQLSSSRWQSLVPTDGI